MENGILENGIFGGKKFTWKLKEVFPLTLGLDLILQHKKFD
jgi:hypothetical protein